MKVLIFGPTGMVGQGVLRECLLATDVSNVTTVGRSLLALDAPKLRQFVQADLMTFESRATELQGYDACFSVWAFRPQAWTKSNTARSRMG